MPCDSKTLQYIFEYLNILSLWCRSEKGEGFIVLIMNSIPISCWLDHEQFTRCPYFQYLFTVSNLQDEHENYLTLHIYTTTITWVRRHLNRRGPIICVTTTAKRLQLQYNTIICLVLISLFYCLHENTSKITFLCFIISVHVRNFCRILPVS